MKIRLWQRYLLTACVLTLALPCALAGTPQLAPEPPPSAAEYVLTWSDEFNAPDGSLPDPKKWTYDVGGDGWGNQELESYTNRAENAQINGGNLVITMRKEEWTGPDEHKRPYTSARLKTKGLFAQAYGRIAARIKIPKGEGVWPAFWMLGDDIDKVGWPASGEIDIMENIGKEPTTIHGTIHGPGFSGASGLNQGYNLSSGKFADDFHVFAIEWEPGQLRFVVDSTLYATRTPASLPPRGKWVFEHPFFLILNLAVGGAWPGSPDSKTAFPQTMLVDYVRVYAKAVK